MRELARVEEYQSGKHTINVGDTVKCKPPAGGSFKGVVRKILTEHDEVVEVEVFHPGAGAAIRTFLPDRISPITISKRRGRKT